MAISNREGFFRKHKWRILLYTITIVCASAPLLLRMWTVMSDPEIAYDYFFNIRELIYMGIALNISNIVIPIKIKPIKQLGYWTGSGLLIVGLLLVGKDLLSFEMINKPASVLWQQCWTVLLTVSTLVMCYFTNELKLNSYINISND